MSGYICECGYDCSSNHVRYTTCNEDEQSIYVREMVGVQSQKREVLVCPDCKRIHVFDKDGTKYVYAIEKTYKSFKNGLSTIASLFRTKPLKSIVIQNRYELKLYDDITEDTPVAIGIYASALGEGAVVVINKETKKEVGELVCRNIPLQIFISCILDVCHCIKKYDIVVLRNNEGNILIDTLHRYIATVKHVNMNGMNMNTMKRAIVSYVKEKPEVFTSDTLFQQLHGLEQDGDTVKFMNNCRDDVLLAYITAAHSGCMIV